MMAAAEIPESVSFQMNLRVGTDSSGNAKTTNVSLGKLSVTRYSDDTALSLSRLLNPIMAGSLMKNVATHNNLVART